MAVVQGEAAQQCSPGIGDIIVIGVLQKKKLRSLAHVRPAIAEQNACSQVQAISKDGHFIRPAIIIGVLQDLNAVSGLCAGRCALRILVKLDNPKPATFIPGHGYGIHHVRFGCEKADLETLGDDKHLLSLSRRHRRSGGRSVGTGELPANPQDIE